MESGGAEKTIRTLEEWEFCKEALDPAVLLQMGSPTCVKCPEFTRRIDALKSGWKFNHVYVNVHDVEQDLYEELGVTQLPAYIIVSSEKTVTGEGASPDQIAQAVQSTCPAVLVLDADF